MPRLRATLFAPPPGSRASSGTGTAAFAAACSEPSPPRSTTRRPASASVSVSASTLVVSRDSTRAPARRSRFDASSTSRGRRTIRVALAFATSSTCGERLWRCRRGAGAATGRVAPEVVGANAIVAPSRGPQGRAGRGCLGRDLGGAHEGGAVVEHDPHGNLLEEARHAALRGECAHEAAIGEAVDDARGNTAAEVDTAGGHERQGDVPGPCAVDRGE